jgi:hypothetical protein
MKNKFWKAIALFAFKQIDLKSDVMKIGWPGIRDTHALCSSYMPGKFKNRGFSHCDGDGHYLCNDCRFFKGNESN